MKKSIGIILLIISMVLLVLGLTFPFMTINFDFKMKGLLGLFNSGAAEQFSKTYSIPDVMRILFKHGYYFVGSLIGFFAVIIPAIKTILTTIFLFNQKSGLYKFINIIGKFAMADIFCVGVLIAFLYTKYNQGLDLQIKAEIESGYYFFASYVIINIIALILLKPAKQPHNIL